MNDEQRREWRRNYMKTYLQNMSPEKRIEYDRCKAESVARYYAAHRDEHLERAKEYSKMHYVSRKMVV